MTFNVTYPTYVTLCQTRQDIKERNMFSVGIDAKEKTTQKKVKRKKKIFLYWKRHVNTSVVIERRSSYAQNINIAMKTVHVVTNIT